MADPRRLRAWLSNLIAKEAVRLQRADGTLNWQAAETQATAIIKREHFAHWLVAFGGDRHGPRKGARRG